MTADEFSALLDELSTPTSDVAGAILFAVRQVPGSRSYYIGKDTTAQACLLVVTEANTGRKPPPIRLESLDAQFDLVCQVTDETENVSEGRFTVIRCRSHDVETARYFLSVCRILIRHLGDLPSQRSLSAAVQRIASIFQSIRKPPSKSLNGLFGELFLISQSRKASVAVAAWRIDGFARFDFATGDVRVDVKSSASRLRTHSFSFDQCNPPPGTDAIVASVLVERIPGGLSIAGLIDIIESMVSADEELVLKLHEIVAATLGADLAKSLNVSFDSRLAESSLLFFDLRDIPSIRGPLPAGVTDVRFTSDLSGQGSLSVTKLIDRNPIFWDLLPPEKG